MKAQRWSSPWLFCILTFGFTWLCWFPMTLPGGQGSTPLMLLGAAAPGIVGILLTTLTQDRESRRKYWQQILDWRRCSLRWALLILLSYPIMVGLGLLIARVVSGGQPSFSYAAQVLASFMGALSFLVTEILGGPVIEEPGWRGYLLPRLQDRHGPIAASLLIGVIWAIWHVPLFFIPGTIHHDMGFGTPASALFVLDLLSWSVLLTFVFNGTGRSVAAAMLLHFSHNFTITITQMPLSPANTYYTMIELVVALGIAAGWLAADRKAQARTPGPAR